MYEHNLQRRTKKRSTYKQPYSKSGFRLAKKPLIKRLLIEHFLFFRRFINYFACSCFCEDVQNRQARCNEGCETIVCWANRCVGVILSYQYVFPDVPCVQKLYTETKMRRPTGQQPGTTSASRLGDNPLVNRSLCSSIGSWTCLALRRFTVTKRRRPTGQQPGTKSALRPAGKPRINRG